MKTFNQTITVEIEVDQIAKMLLGSFKEDYAHREMLTETIIGTAINNNTISMVYNNLQGFTNDIDFKEGQVVDCPVDIYTYVTDGDSFKEIRRSIGQCTIIEINSLRTSEKVHVSYPYLNRDGKELVNTKWVSHKNLKLAEQKEEAVTL